MTHPIEPPDPELSCPEPGCDAPLVVIERGWIDPPTLDALEPDAAVYVLECPNGHGRFEYKTGEVPRPVVG